MDCQQLIRDQELVNDYVKRIGESFIAESGSKAYPIYDGVMLLSPLNAVINVKSGYHCMD